MKKNRLFIKLFMLFTVLMLASVFSLTAAAAEPYNAADGAAVNIEAVTAGADDTVSDIAVNAGAVAAGADSTADDAAANAEYQVLSSSGGIKRNLVEIILLSAVVSIVVTVVIYFKYKFNGKTEPYPYNKKAPLNLSVSEDIHIDTKVERKKIEKNNN